MTEINLKTASPRNHTMRLQNAAYLKLYIITVVIHFFWYFDTVIYGKVFVV